MERYENKGDISNDVSKSKPESTIIFNEKTGRASLIVRTKGATMVEDIYKAFKELQRMAGIKEEE